MRFRAQGGAGLEADGWGYSHMAGVGPWKGWGSAGGWAKYIAIMGVRVGEGGYACFSKHICDVVLHCE